MASLQHSAELKVEGCQGSLTFTTDPYRSGLDGAVAFMGELLCAGYDGTVNGQRYVMNYQTDRAEVES